MRSTARTPRAIARANNRSTSYTDFDAYTAVSRTMTSTQNKEPQTKKEPTDDVIGGMTSLPPTWHTLTPSRSEAEVWAQSLYETVTTHRNLMDAHTVDFFTQSHWDSRSTTPPLYIRNTDSYWNCSIEQGVGKQIIKGMPWASYVWFNLQTQAIPESCHQ